MKILQTLYRFHNKENDSSCGLYCVELDSGNKHYFLQNDKSVGAITHYWGRPASNCVSIVKDNIKEKFFVLLEETSND
jgi:hypothetical protein